MFFFFIIYFFIQLPRKALADCLKSFCTLQLQRTKQAACNCPTRSQTRQEEEVPTKVCLVLLNLIPFPAKVDFFFHTLHCSCSTHSFKEHTNGDHFLAVLPQLYQTPSDRCEGSNFTSAELISAEAQKLKSKF